MNPLQKQLIQLEHRGLISVATLMPEIEYLFRHALVQDTAYDSLLRQDRRKLHRVVGEALERSYPDRLDELAAQLATHFEEAGEDQRALVYYTRAAKRAARSYANAEAAMYYGSAAQIARRTGATSGDLSTLYMAWGRMLELSQDFVGAFEAYQQLEAIAEERSDSSLRLAGQTGQVLLLSTPTPLMNPPRGMEIGEAALALAEQLNDQAAQGRILWALTLGNYFHGNVQQAVAYGDRSLAINRRLGQRDQLAYIMNDISRPYMSLGKVNEAIDVLSEVVILWRELGNLAMLADATNALAEALHLRGEYARVAEMGHEAASIAEMMGNKWGYAHGLWISAYGLWELGEFGRALRISEVGHETAEASGLTLIAGVGLSETAGMYSILGEQSRARELITKSLNYLAGSNIFTAWINSVAATVSLQLGELPQAAEYLATARVSLHLDDFSTPASCIYSIALATYHLRQNQPEQALEAIDAMLPLLRERDLNGPRPDLLRLRAEVLTELNQPQEARENLIEARDLGTRLGAKRALWPILMQLASFEAPDQAMALRSEARTIVQSLIATLDGMPEQPLFANQPAIRAVMEATIPTS